MHLTIPDHPLDRATTLVMNEDGSYTGQTDKAYVNMVGPFGGITAAAIMKALLMHPARLGDPVSLTVNFAAPIADGTYRILAEPVRTNRSTQHWSISLIQGDELTTTASAVFARRKDTWSTTEIAMPEVPAATEVPRSRLVNTERAWFDQYEMRFIQGHLLDQTGTEGERDAVTVLWVRDDPPRPLDFVSLTAICDSFAPRVMVRRAKWVPSGTVSMTIYFHASQLDMDVQGAFPLLGTARASHFGRGYHDQTAEFWSGSGRILATSHQMVYFKE